MRHFEVDEGAVVSFIALPKEVVVAKLEFLMSGYFFLGLLLLFLTVFLIVVVFFLCLFLVVILHNFRSILRILL